MQEICPDAWLLNLTNPMTTLCRAITRETPIKTIGLCHELTITRFTLSLLLDADFRSIDLEVDRGEPPARHHRASTSRAATASTLLREVLADPSKAGEPLAFDLPEDFGTPSAGPGGQWTRGDLLDAQPAQARAVPTGSASCPRRAIVTWPSSFPASSPSSRAGASAGG